MSKYESNVGAAVDVFKIVELIDAVSGPTHVKPPQVKLNDGSIQPRPLTHGYRPQVGDYYVVGTPVRTQLLDGTAYTEVPGVAIVPQHEFKKLYREVQSPLADSLDV